MSTDHENVKISHEIVMIRDHRDRPWAVTIKSESDDWINYQFTHLRRHGRAGHEYFSLGWNTKEGRWANGRQLEWLAELFYDPVSDLGHALDRAFHHLASISREILLRGN